ncbi:Toxin RTX-I translocation ATP-binding protein [Curvibacter sp. AEP1-3]|uniref:peptidase domain-containing ABC transporter n=1 Tax=Curvibacter sp. AEP1-3 TaxID=1844971 RepID=UPI000B3BE7AF|nr:type I secretion system permease/ATPase [Curvibacter sp. AEP1-3]ARV18644.1 Toxin RTX-I translocation ATP-binding protein [Curvibacter sp. AEP1-3]
MSTERKVHSPARTGLDCVRMIGMYFEKPMDSEWLWREFAQESIGFDRISVSRALKHLGFSVTLKKVNAATLTQAVFPAMLEFKDGTFGLLGKLNGQTLQLQVPGEASSRLVDIRDFQDVLAPQWLSIKKLDVRLSGEKFGISWLFQSLLRYRGLLGETLMASFCLQIFALISPLAFQVVIDKVLVHKGLSTLDVIVLGLAVASVFEILLTGLRTYVLTHTTNRVDAELGSRIYRHLLSLPMTYFATRKVGEIVARVREMEAVRAFFTGSGLSSGIDLFFTVFFLAVMAYYSWDLTLVVVISLPLFLALAMTLIPLLNRYVEDRFVKAAENQSFLVESIAGMETVKSMTAETRFQRQWEEKLAQYVRASFKTGHLSNLTQQGVQLISKALNLILLWMGAKLVLEGKLSVGQLIAFNMLSARVNAPILRLATLWQEIQQMRVSLRRLGDILDSPVEAPPNASLSLERLQGDVQFDGVGFKYQSDGRDILKDVHLHIKPGELVGIVGSSGSGKSTLAKLLMKLYVPSRGRVLLDGADIGGINPLLIRRQLAVVTQDVVLFSKSVRDNIAMGQLDVSLEAIIEAARMAGADEFIRKLPHGYDTVLEERGSNLSGGQRQRIAIARALIMQPRILILDEATSMLDADTEMRFWAHIRAIAEKRTVISITHRLATVLDMDRIVVMEDGSVVEEGIPSELLRCNGRFAELYRLQLGVKSEGHTPPQLNTQGALA